MRVLMGFAISLTLAALCAAAPVPKHLMPKVEQPSAERLAGTWTPKDQPQLGTIEYTKDGKMTMRNGVNGVDGVVESTFKIEAGKLFETTNMAAGPQTVAREITRLTDNEFAYKLPDGSEWVLVRVKDRK